MLYKVLCFVNIHYCHSTCMLFGMWVMLSFFALFALVIRRSAEKNTSKKIDSMTLSWLQQFMAMPFIIATLFLAPFYLPTQVTPSFWQIMAVYVVCTAIDLYCYFKALSLADISYVAPLLALIAAGNVIGAYFVLGQQPTIWGFAGALLIVAGAILNNRGKRAKSIGEKRNNSLALLLIVILVVVRSYYSNIELFMLREVNPTTFNFYSSVLTVPLLIAIAAVFWKRQGQSISYYKHSFAAIKNNFWALSFIGLTYTVNLLATYQAKILSPNAGYVGAIKSAQVLPMVLIGMMLFHEHVTKKQWYGLGLICLGLVGLSLN
jgi:drug/metabolite transporter (DMT)-like permease